MDCPGCSRHTHYVNDLLHSCFRFSEQYCYVRRFVKSLFFSLRFGNGITSAKSQSATWGCYYWMWKGQGGTCMCAESRQLQGCALCAFQKGDGCLCCQLGKTDLLSLTSAVAAVSVSKALSRNRCCCPSCLSWNSVSNSCCISVALKLLACGCWDCLTAQTVSSFAGCCERP